MAWKSTRLLANIPFICYFHIRILYSNIIFHCHIPLWYSVYIFHYHMFMQLLYSILIFHCYIPLIYIYSEVIFHYHIPLFSVIYSIIFDISMDNGKDYPIYYGKIKAMFQTTNQYIYIQYIYIYTVYIYIYSPNYNDILIESSATSSHHDIVMAAPSWSHQPRCFVEFNVFFLNKTSEIVVEFRLFPMK